MRGVFKFNSAELRDLYEVQGKSASEIAVIAGSSQSTALRYLSLAGVSMRPFYVKGQSFDFRLVSFLKEWNDEVAF